MSKITKEDLERLFGQNENENESENENKKSESHSQKISIHKVKSSNHDDLVLRHVRRKISKISSGKKDTKSPWDAILRFAAVAGFSGFIFFAVMNYPAYLTQLGWLYHVNYLGESLPQSNPTPTPTASPQANKKLSLPILPSELDSHENSIKIDKIGITAPVIWDVDEKDILDNLKEGVVHYKGTSRPGEGGNVFIVGHSSNYFWIKSDYNHVFALLNKLETGDRIEIKSDGTSYFYNVFQSKVVSPNDVGILDSSNREILTLMTCWPVGTSLNRLIVQAEYFGSSI